MLSDRIRRTSFLLKSVFIEEGVREIRHPQNDGGDMRYLPDGKWMQKADAYTIGEIGIPSLVLMERAALGTVETMKSQGTDLTKVLAVCGSGNNGGDGFAVVRLLQAEGYDTCAVFVGNETSMSDECRLQREIAEKTGVRIVTEIPDEEYSVIIDAVFGVGLSRELQGHYRKIVEKMNQMSGCKVAVDIPTGINSKDGSVMGTAFRADLTVSFGCEKLGTVFFPGYEYAGKTVPVEIGIQTGLFSDSRDVCYTLEKQDLEELLPARKKDSHKGTYGKILMITGSKGMSGAAYLSARAAYTAGGGLVRIYTEESNRVILQQLLPEAIISTYTAYEEVQLSQMLDWADTVCIGCGLSTGDTAEQIMQYVMGHVKVPCVIDADGLNLLSRHMEWLPETEKQIVLTPHMKEMAGMTDCTISELSEKRFEILKQFTEKYGVVCALKDTRTVVAARGRQCFVNTAGNSAMAKAGSGDVLAGLTTGFLAQRMDAYRGAVLGVYLHACGGDEARKKCGAYSVLAEDLTDGIRTCIRQTKKGR